MYVIQAESDHGKRHDMFAVTKPEMFCKLSTVVVGAIAVLGSKGKELSAVHDAVMAEAALDLERDIGRDGAMRIRIGGYTFNVSRVQ